MNFNNKAIVAIAPEPTTYGTPMTASLAYLMASNMNADINTISKPREVLNYQGTGSETVPVTLIEGGKITFKTELIPGVSSEEQVYPSCHNLLLACGFDHGWNTSVHTYVCNESYTPVTGYKSLTCYFWKDNFKYEINGCVGTVKISSEANGILTADWEFQGKITTSKIIDSAFPTPGTLADLNATPIIGRSVTVTINGNTSMVCKNITFDLGNEVTKREDISATDGIHSFFVKKRQVKGTVNPETVTLATFNPFTLAENGTTMDISAAYYYSSHNGVKVTAQDVVLEMPKYADRENILTYELSFKSVADINNYEQPIKIEFGDV